MFTKYRQLFFSAAFLLLGITQFYFFSVIIGSAFMLASAFLAIAYFWLGPTIVGYGEALRGNFLSANELLNAAGDVGKLSSRKRAYYFLTKGLVEESQNNLTAAEDFLNKARCEPMLPRKEEASIRVRLARIYLVQGRDEEAATQIDRMDMSAAGRRLKAEAGALSELVNRRTEAARPPRRSLFGDDE